VHRFGLVLAALLLGGCFYSEDVLIGRFSADFPLAEGLYSHTPYHPDGRPFDRASWQGEIETRGGRYVSDADDFPHEGTRLRELSPGVFAAMRENDGLYLYGLVFVFDDNLASYHQPSCGDFEQVLIERYDVEPHEEEPSFCKVSDWDRLSGLLLSYVAATNGQPRMDGVYRRVD
jgi:hypothetical protein